MINNIGQYLDEKYQLLNKEIFSMCDSKMLNVNILKIQAEGLFQSFISEMNSDLYEYYIDLKKSVDEINSIEDELKRRFESYLPVLGKMKNENKLEDRIGELEKKNIEYIDKKSKYLRWKREQYDCFNISSEQDFKRSEIIALKKSLEKSLKSLSEEIEENIEIINIKKYDTFEVSMVKREIRKFYLDLRVRVKNREYEKQISYMRDQILKQAEHLILTYRTYINENLISEREDIIFNSKSQIIETIVINFLDGNHIEIQGSELSTVVGEDKYRELLEYLSKR